jgi:hypothetical protein
MLVSALLVLVQSLHRSKQRVLIRIYEQETYGCSAFTCWTKGQQIATIVVAIIVAFLAVLALAYCRSAERKDKRGGKRDIEMQPRQSRARIRHQPRSESSHNSLAISTQANVGKKDGKKEGASVVTRAKRDRTPDWARRASGPIY